MSTPQDTPRETPPARQPGQPWPPDLRLLRRSVGDRKVAGVCGGAGEWLGIDPLLLRVVVVVLTLFGGSGPLIYGLAWLLVPQDGERESHGQRLLRREVSTGAVAAAAVTLAGIGASGQSLGTGSPSGLLLLAVIGTGIVLAVRQGSPPAGPDAGVPSSSPPAGPAAGVRPTPFAPHGPYAGAGPHPMQPPAVPRRPHRPRRSRRERSHLGVLTLSVLLVVVGTAAGLMTAGGSGVDATVLVALALAVVGLGLLVGTVAGRARGLIPLGILLSLILGAATAAQAVLPSGGFGERTWTPRTAAELRGQAPYALGVGAVVLDLRELRTVPSGTTTLPDTAVEVGAGQITVWLPDDLDVTLRASAEGGEIVLPDGAAPSSGAGADVRTVLSDGVEGGPAMKLDLNVGVGQIEVRR